MLLMNIRTTLSFFVVNENSIFLLKIDQIRLVTYRKETTSKLFFIPQNLTNGSPNKLGGGWNKFEQVASVPPFIRDLGVHTSVFLEKQR